jgi:hypothetical protein
MTLAMTERPVRGLELVMAELQVPDLIIGELSGSLDFGALRRAAARVQARHPGLRALVERGAGRPSFRHHRPDATRIDVHEIACDADVGGDPSRPRWERAAEREANHRFDLTHHFGFRVVWVPSEGGGHLIVNAPHALVDGISLMRLLHEVLSEAVRVAAGEPLAAVSPLGPTPAVLDSVRLGAFDSAIGYLAKKVTIHQQKAYAKKSAIPIEARLRGGEWPTACSSFRAGSKEAYTLTRARCRERGVTVGGLYTAAVEFAAVRHLARQAGALPTRWTFATMGQAIRLPISMDFSLRRFIAGASKTQEAIGLFTGVAEVTVSAPTEITLWDLARLLMSQSRRQIERRVPLLFHEVLDGILDLRAELRRHGITYEESGGAGDAFNVSNVGDYPFATRHGAVSLRHVFGLNGALLGGPAMICWLRTIDGHFCYNAMTATPACDRKLGERIFADVVDIMERAGQGAFDDLAIEAYAEAR